MATAGKRRSDSDVLKLIESNYEVNLNNGLNKFTVKFHGPPNTLYENGVWKIRVELTERYPFEPPVICFLNKIYHPNIDEVSGNVCLDVLNQKWSAMFDLINIFESFLPQLLTYPNSKDPLNSEAGIMYEEDLQAYENRVRDYINRYATESSLVTTTDDDNKRFRGTSQESPASPKPEPTTPPPETEGDHYSSESSMSDDDDDDDDAKSDHEDATAGSSAGRNKAFGSNEPKEPPSATITSPPFDDDESTIEDDQYLEHFNYVHSFDEAKD